MPSERTFQAKAIAALKGRGAYVVKVYNDGHTRSGTPDLIVCYRGCFIAFECKTPKLADPATAVSIDQRIHAEEINKAGGAWFVVNTLEKVLRVLDVFDQWEITFTDDET